MTQLSPHFTLHEATFSATAEREGLDNTPDAEALECIKTAAHCMEAVRSMLGGKPIKVTSWYRSPEVNKAVGGSETSSHLTGLAVDFVPSDMSALLAAHAIDVSPLMFDQLIYYPDEQRLHIGWGQKDRRQLMTKRKGKGYEQGLNNGHISVSLARGQQ